MKRRDAFTMTELLVLIAASTMLGALLVASLGDAKQKAQAAVCASNLRQIGVAISMYANDHNDYYPPGYVAAVGDWPLFIGPYLGKHQISYGQGPFDSSRAFLCPSGVQSGAYNGLPVRLMYSAHPTLMPSANFAGSNLYRRSRVSRASEIILIGDGAQQTAYYAGSFDSAAEFDAINQAFITYPDNQPDRVMTQAGMAGANSDDNRSASYLRFRHYGNTVANFLFCDGHVEWMAFGQVKQRNFYYDP